VTDKLIDYNLFVKGLGKPVASPLVKIGGSDHLPVAVDLDLSKRSER
jgi:endonuclease/exonuclease/phosphatase family metal-dependent hydrolase